MPNKKTTPINKNIKAPNLIDQTESWKTTIKKMASTAQVLGGLQFPIATGLYFYDSLYFFVTKEMMFISWAMGLILILLGTDIKKFNQHLKMDINVLLVLTVLFMTYVLLIGGIFGILFIVLLIRLIQAKVALNHLQIKK